jgi:hypothetical protein
MPTRPSPSPTTVSARERQDAAALHDLRDAVDAPVIFCAACRRDVPLLTVLLPPIGFAMFETSPP